MAVNKDKKQDLTLADPGSIEEVLSRGVQSFIDPDGAFRKKLEGKRAGTYTKDIVIKYGIDPTRPDIHLGHAVVIRKLRALQNLGCKVVFLVGDFTATIGDPTGKDKIRPEIHFEEIQKNVITYLEQLDKILLIEREPSGVLRETSIFSWIANSDWFYEITDISNPQPVTITGKGPDGADASLMFPPNSFFAKAALYNKTRMQTERLGRPAAEGITLRGLFWTLKHITHARMIERDMFQKRIAEGRELYMHEMLYPVLQGIDSFILHNIYGSCDLEIGGSDQTFNMLVGRDVMRANNVESQAVLALSLLEGLDGKEKMSKSLDNYIAITDTPNDMYGKIMSLPDASLRNYFELCTYTPTKDVDEIMRGLESGKNHPRDIKMRLAREITALYHGTTYAEKAEQNFIATFVKGGMPADAPTISVVADTLLADALVSAGIVKSKNDFRRLAGESAIRDVGGSPVTDLLARVTGPLDLKIGKHRFVRIRMSED